MAAMRIGLTGTDLEAGDALEIRREQVAFHQRRRVLVGGGIAAFGGVAVGQKLVQLQRKEGRVFGALRGIRDAVLRTRLVHLIECPRVFRHVGGVVGEAGSSHHCRSERQGEQEPHRGCALRRSRISRSSMMFSGGASGVSGSGDFSLLICRSIRNSTRATMMKLTTVFRNTP